jgi:hypothetical protein
MQLKPLLQLSSAELTEWVHKRNLLRKVTLRKPAQRVTVKALASAWHVPPDVLQEKILALFAPKEIE